MTECTSWGPDEWIDPYAPVDRLHQMPLLAAQARLLGQTRNPSGDRRAQRSHSAGSRPAARLDLIDVADDTTEARGELRALILWCSRPIWEGVDLDTRQAHPQPLGTPTWETECAWLAGIWQTSRAQLDLVDLQMSSMTLDDTYRALCRAVGLRKIKPLPCPECGAPLVKDGPILVCEETRWAAWKHEFPGVDEVAISWRRHDAMTTAELCNALPGVTQQRMDDWKRRRGLKPEVKVSGRNLWRPWDVIRILWPDIVEALDAKIADPAARV
jgi:hypothetical protein